MQVEYLSQDYMQIAMMPARGPQAFFAMKRAFSDGMFLWLFPRSLLLWHIYWLARMFYSYDEQLFGVHALLEFHSFCICYAASAMGMHKKHMFKQCWPEDT